MKKFQFKQKRHMITAVCMLVGLMVLTTSVYANYDNANGYSNYKSAMKKLLLDTDNVTIDATMEVYLDGELMAKSENGAKFAKNAESTYSKEYTAGDEDSVYESYQYRDGKMYYSYNPKTNTYYSFESTYMGIDGNFLGIDMDDNTSQKLVRFLELGADMVIGDLKNNVVLIGQDDDALEYEVNVSKNQMPEIVNAGLSLLFSSMNEYSYNTQGVIYDNYREAFSTFSMAEYGRDFDYDVYTDEGEFDPDLAGYDTEKAYWDDYDAAREAFWDKYDGIYEDEYNDTGVLFVKADGSYEYYKTSDEYLDATNNYSGDDIYLMFGDDPYIENAKMTAKMSKSGELLENTLEVTLAGFDRSGERHTATFKGAVSASDYGKTVADVFDPEGKEGNNY